MKKGLSILVFLMANLINAQAPHLEGNVTIKMKEGLIDCNMRLSAIPNIDFTILLNHGMNIENFTDAQNKVLRYEGYYDFESKGEGICYTLAKEDIENPNMPPVLNVRYRGAFPVYNDKSSFTDFKGVIAFNGQTLRASEQSKWYPVLYDAANDRVIDAYTYNITITIDEGQTVYLNGSPPQTQAVSSFISQTPRQLLLFAGNYTFTNAGGNYILNAEMDKETALALFGEMDRIKNFLSSKLKLPYGDNTYLLAHKPLEVYEGNRSWAFVTFPTFAFAGLDFNKTLDENKKMLPAHLHFFAHEASHYYFGPAIHSGNLGWFWLESAAEYMAFKASQELTGQEFYINRLNDYAGFVKGKDFKPLARIKDKEEIGNDYRYKYGPLILICFEKTFGEEKTYAVLATLIKKSEKESITMDVFRETAIESGIPSREFNNFYTTYLNSGRSLKNVCFKVLH